MTPRAVREAWESHLGATGQINKERALVAKVTTKWRAQKDRVQAERLASMESIEAARQAGEETFLDRVPGQLDQFLANLDALRKEAARKRPKPAKKQRAATAPAANHPYRQTQRRK
jgi:hypothetical protein